MFHIGSRMEASRGAGGAADVERQPDTTATGGAGGHEREASGRSVLSGISTRLAAMRAREREAERIRHQNMNPNRPAHAMAERLLYDLNNWRGLATPGVGGNGAAGVDVEAQLGNANNGTATAGASSMRKITGKSRREREEGATLFGPNLANYFGSGSSTSGAVAGSTPAVPSTLSSSNAAAAAAAAATTAAAQSAEAGSLRRPRLGSRGRARGASLSGLSQYSLQGEVIESVNSLSDLNARGTLAAADGDVGGGSGELAMAEGIELETLRRWIERSTVGGTAEVANAEEAAQVRGHAGNPGTLCSTLQSYVNLKRNTIKLNALTDVASEEGSYKTSMSPLSPLSPWSGGNHTHVAPPSTHTIQFEYDCAAPFASVQVFVRASRKHGSWAAWTLARETMGMPTDLTIGADDDGESRFLGLRGPPPHVLGWPIHLARVRKGFGVPQTVQLALRLELYAPPKAANAAGPTEERDEQEMISNAPPETPGLDASHRLEDPVTPAVTSQPVADPMAAYTAQGMRRFTPDPISSLSPGAMPVYRGLHFAMPPPPPPLPATTTADESKEAKAAKERAERETLKIAVVVEALDEDGKPLREPNLQTTYMRIASLPIRQVSENRVELEEEATANIGDELRGAGAVVDVAVSPQTPVTGDSAAAMPTTPLNRRAWSVQVEGQEAEIGPHRFQLQELYGLSTRPPPPQQQRSEAEAGEEGAEDGGVSNDAMPRVDLMPDDNGGATECLICLSSPPSTLLLPCTHGLCLDCAVQLRDTVKATRESERRRGRRPKRKYACPVCRRVYTSMLHLSAVDEKYLAQAAEV